MARDSGIWAAYYMGGLVSLMIGVLMGVQDKLNNPFNTCVALVIKPRHLEPDTDPS